MAPTHGWVRLSQQWCSASSVSPRVLSRPSSRTMALRYLRPSATPSTHGACCQALGVMIWRASSRCAHAHMHVRTCMRMLTRVRMHCMDTCMCMQALGVTSWRVSSRGGESRRTTYHLPPTTYHLPPTAYRSPLFAGHSPHLPPTTYHLPPTAHHFPHLPPTAHHSSLVTPHTYQVVSPATYTLTLTLTLTLPGGEPGHLQRDAVQLAGADGASALCGLRGERRPVRRQLRRSLFALGAFNGADGARSIIGCIIGHPRRQQ